MFAVLTYLARGEARNIAGMILGISRVVAAAMGSCL
jgi:hypothetical protein